MINLYFYTLFNAYFISNYCYIRMDILQETREPYKKTFFNHVFSTSEEGKAELLNVIQYSILGIIPIVILNKLISRFIPEADPDNSSLELLAEIFIQIVIMFCGIILIHRMITYIPSYSGFKYENLILTNVILAFLILVLSIQTKLGIKVNIIVDRIYDLWEGTSYSSSGGGSSSSKKVATRAPMSQHMPSQADHIDNSFMQTDMFPPAPVATNKPPNNTYDTMMRGSGTGGGSPIMDSYMGPMAANTVLGGAFGSAF